MTDAHDPKARIAAELGKAEPNWRLIEKWSREEVDADLSNVRFTSHCLPMQNPFCIICVQASGHLQDIWQSASRDQRLSDGCFAGYMSPYSKRDA